MSRENTHMQARKAAWRALYAGERRSVALIHYDDGPRPWPFATNEKERIEYALRSYRAQCERTQWLDDDRVPYLAPYTGTEIFAQAFGCKVHTPKDNMPFALPAVCCAQQAARLAEPDPDEALAQVWEIAYALHEAEPDALLALPDIQSPLDIAALIWEKSDFYPAMIEEPEAVETLLAKVYRLLTGFLDRWFARFGRECIAHYPDYYMPYGVTLSEDEVGVIGTGMFERFCLPDLQALSARYGAIGIHCCANSEHQWKNFLRIPNLKTLNLVRSPQSIEQAYPFFRDACVQMHSMDNVTVEGIACLPESASGSRVILQARAGTREEAIGKLAVLRELEAGR